MDEDAYEEIIFSYKKALGDAEAHAEQLEEKIAYLEKQLERPINITVNMAGNDPDLLR